MDWSKALGFLKWDWRRMVIFAYWGVVSIIVVISFTLSYTNLVKMATESGWTSDLAWLWPLGIDLFMVLASVYILLKSMMDGESAWVGWVTLFSYTILSIFFNVAHTPLNTVNDLYTVVSHAVPPVTLCLSLEFGMLLIKMVDKDIFKRKEAERVAEEALLEPEPVKKVRTQSKRITDPAILLPPQPVQESPVISEPVEEHQETEEIPVETSNDDLDSLSKNARIVYDFFKGHPEYSSQKGADFLGMNWGTVDSNRKKLIKQGFLEPIIKSQ